MITTYIDHPLRERNSFHVEEQASCLIEFDKASDLDSIFAAGSAPKRWMVIGGGNNILFTQHFDGTLIHPTGNKITLLSETPSTISVEAEAGVDWDEFVQWAVDRGVWGAENLSLIPGTVGAAPVQNIGAYGSEAKDIIHAVHYYDVQLGEHRTLLNQECKFGYRDSIFKGELRGRAIITSVEFRLSKDSGPHLIYDNLRAQVEAYGQATVGNIREIICSIRRSKLPDPNELGNAGSFFKNPIVHCSVTQSLKQKYDNIPIYPTLDPEHNKLAAGWLIDKAGLKGYRTGNVGVHDKQALVLVNHGGATGGEVMALARYVQDEVARCFGIAIEPEVNIL